MAAKKKGRAKGSTLSQSTKDKMKAARAAIKAAKEAAKPIAGQINEQNVEYVVAALPYELQARITKIAESAAAKAKAARIAELKKELEALES